MRESNQKKKTLIGEENAANLISIKIENKERMAKRINNNNSDNFEQ